MRAAKFVINSMHYDKQIKKEVKNYYIGIIFYHQLAIIALYGHTLFVA
jgi:hypothetical protein